LQSVHGKRVQFGAENEYYSTKETLIEPVYELCDEIKTNLWWSPEEQEENGKERKNLLKQFVAFQEDDADTSFTALHTNCASMNFSQVMRSKATKQYLVDVANTDGLRGLEARLSKGISRRWKEHVFSLLSVERKLGGGASADILSATSSQSSQTSQILARVLTQIDARESGV
jgi:hypothetical protein